MAKVIKFDDKKMYLDSHTKKIKDTIAEVTSDYMYVAFLLWEVREYQYYEGVYKDVVEYAEKELDMSRSTTFRYIQLCENFSARTKSGCPSMRVADYYKGYSVAKMFEILSMKPEDRELVKPEMSLREIKELKKRLKEEQKQKVASPGLENVERLKTTELNELRCENCGKSYLVDESNKKQWIVLQGKPVASCCFQISYDIDLLKRQ